MKGIIGNSPVSILIDSGSTHNFVQERIAKSLGLTFEPAQAFQVLVGNGEELPCSFVCPNITLRLGSYSVTVDLYVLPLSGAELVLGVQ